MFPIKTLWILSVVHITRILCDASSDYNKVNNDGSFSFGLYNNDVGGHYHEASGSADKIVRGRYGSRSPASGRVEETVYTAGPRGFRARGPRIHRKMDLTQYPQGPIGLPFDPRADPYEDPSYDFAFTTSNHKREESADSTGRVRGLYSYTDDVGEYHTVRYAAGAGTGFEVLNSVPDSAANVAYAAPLYKAPRGTRGRMSTQRGPNGQYRFILSAPDHRRSESSDPDGLVRGSYSYLDDKGIQRTVQYIAGAGIGYRIVQSITGAGSHLTPKPAFPDYGIRDQHSNDLADDGYLKTSESGRLSPKDPERALENNREASFGTGSRDRYNDGGDKFNDDEKYNSGEKFGNRNKFGARDKVDDGADFNDRGDRFNDRSKFNNRNDNGFKSYDRNYTPTEEEKNKDFAIHGGSKRPKLDEDKIELYDPKRRPLEGGSNKFGYRYGESGGPKPGGGSSWRPLPDGDVPSGIHDNDDDYSLSGKFGKGGTRSHSAPGNEFATNRNRVSSDRLANRRGYDSDDQHNEYPSILTDPRRLHEDRDRDWAERGRDSTIVKNIGKWYVGLPPGASVRAHVQNIDLLPLGGRQPSPSTALRRDELKRFNKRSNF